MSGRVDDREVSRIAKLARLNPDPDEKQRLTNELDRIIDYVNQLRAEGRPKLQAIVEGGCSRLRPILMTTVTTLVGFLPLALGLGEGAEIRQPMAVTVIAGLAVSTVLTLIVIPVMYALLDRKPDQYYVDKQQRTQALHDEVAPL